MKLSDNKEVQGLIDKILELQDVKKYCEEDRDLRFLNSNYWFSPSLFLKKVISVDIEIQMNFILGQLKELGVEE